MNYELTVKNSRNTTTTFNVDDGGAVIAVWRDGVNAATFFREDGKLRPFDVPTAHPAEREDLFLLYAAIMQRDGKW